MNKFGELIDAPVTGEKRKTLPRPEPGWFEYRIYFDFHTRIVFLGEDDTGEQLEVPAARFVYCTAQTEPTDEQWTTLLLEKGYTKEQIKNIL